MARRHNDPARTREQILAKATDEFARLGFEGGRVDRIAARCNLSKNMLYYYFQSKEKLFVAVLIYLIYSNLLGVANTWLAQGRLAPLLGMWWVHLAVLLGTWLMFVRQYGLGWIMASMFGRRSLA